MARNASAPTAASTQERRYLAVAFRDKDEVKALGAQFDLTRKAWFVPPGVDIEPFTPWLKT
jgi:DNA helicase-2/ATP-dependent DNA helicase PcrA